jgi:hypothetical protein
MALNLHLIFIILKEVVLLPSQLLFSLSKLPDTLITYPILRLRIQQLRKTLDNVPKRIAHAQSVALRLRASYFCTIGLHFAH